MASPLAAKARTANYHALRLLRSPKYSLPDTVPASMRSRAVFLSSTVERRRSQLTTMLKGYCNRLPKRCERDAIMIGLVDCAFGRTAEHAAVDNTVAAYKVRGQS